MVEMVGVSKVNWSDAARQAVERASEKHPHITGLDVLHSTAMVRDGKIVEYHVNVKLAYITEPARIDAGDKLTTTCNEDHHERRR
jgi:flavin-binding protein dodecin